MKVSQIGQGFEKHFLDRKVMKIYGSMSLEEFDYNLGESDNIYLDRYLLLVAMKPLRKADRIKYR